MTQSLRNLSRSLAGLLLIGAVASGAPQQSSYETAPVNYSKSTPTDPVSDLQRRLESARTRLDYGHSHGYLKSLLQALDIPISSQGLVFSKTSFQRQWINPRSPRAVYFNDEVYVGWVQGAEVLELASQDPQLGTVFYTVAQEPEKPARFQRQTDLCLQCHDSTGLTLGVPGVTVRSIFSAPDGQPRFNLGGFRTTYRSPFEDRWGGWYVTGSHGDLRHMGNIWFPDDPNPDLKQLRDRGANLADLGKRIDVDPYLAASSDIVALMVLEYQTTVHNLITRANHETRVAVAQSDDLNRATGAPLRPLTDGARRRIGYACEPLVEALFYAEEAPIAGRVAGNSTFAADFEKRGPFDSKGRSLRQFDLQKRMFKHPLSYLIYSKTFAGLPTEAREWISRRVTEILAGRETKNEYAHLTAEERRTLLEIVRETAPGLLTEGK